MNKEEIKTIINQYVSGGYHTILNKCGISKTCRGKSYEEKLKAYDQKMHKLFNEKEPIMYTFLQQELGNDFTAENLYNYLYGVNNEYRGRFISLYTGYEKYNYIDKKVDLSFIKTKEELYTFICKHYTEHFTLNRLKNHTNIVDYFSEIKNIDNYEELFLYLTGKTKYLCDICGKPTKFISFSGSKKGRFYKQFCCDECRQIWWAKKQQEDNTSNRMTEETKKNAALKQSIRVKNYIKSGRWTPAITNSWCHSKIKLKYILNNVIVSKNVRSSWEAFFQLLNPNLEYETLRIPYYDTEHKITRNYIVDFIDNENKIVYEVKPYRCKSKQSNIDKFNALEEWCKTNDYKMNIITEDYFQQHIFKISYLQYMEDDQKEKLLKLLKGNKFNIDYEN